jgi:hypothetical protein
MRRAGGWVLGVIAVAAMAVGGWIAFWPILNRETLKIEFMITHESRPPSSDAMISGARFAVEEAGSRAGGYRIQFDASEVDPTGENCIVTDPGLLLVARIGNLAFSLFPSLEDTGRAAGVWAKSSGARKTVVLCDQSGASSIKVLQGFRLQARADGLTFDEPIDTAIDRNALLDRVITAGPDLVFYSGEAAPYVTAYDLFDALRKRGYTGRLAMADADAEVSFLAVSNRVVDGTFLISPIGPPSKEFAARYEPATKRHAGPHAWPAYLTMKAILDGVDRAASRRPEDLRRVLAERPPPQLPCALYEMKAGKFQFVRDLK